MVAVKTNAAIRLAVITADVKLAKSWRKMAEDVKVPEKTVCFLMRKQRTSIECKYGGCFPSKPVEALVLTIAKGISSSCA